MNIFSGLFFPPSTPPKNLTSIGFTWRVRCPLLRRRRPLHRCCVGCPRRRCCPGSGRGLRPGRGSCGGSAFGPRAMCCGNDAMHILSIPCLHEGLIIPQLSEILNKPFQRLIHNYYPQLPVNCSSNRLVVCYFGREKKDSCRQSAKNGTPPTYHLLLTIG